MTLTRLIFVRHGQTSWNKKGKIQGRNDLPLSPEGVVQAREVADYIYTKKSEWSVSKVYSSPLKRAYETAKAIASRIELPVVDDLDLMEVDFGEISGLSWSEVERDHSEFLKTFRSDPFNTFYPNGESQATALLRAEAFMDRALEENLGVGAVVVAHAAILRVMIGRVLELEHRNEGRMSISNCSVSVAKFETSEIKGSFETSASMETLNDCHFMSFRR